MGPLKFPQTSPMIFLLNLFLVSLVSAAPRPQHTQETGPDPAASQGVGPVQTQPSAPDFVPQKYMAFGDSFAAGIGAGSELGFVHFDNCHRYNGGYPFRLNELIYGHSMPEDNLKACTGATAEEVKAQAQFLDESVDLATISVGGNNVFFSGIVQACVYRFKGSLDGDCDSAIKRSEEAIDNTLGPAVKDALQAFFNRPLNPKIRFFVTGYAKFFNADTPQCDEVSWNYWDLSSPEGGADKMDKNRRRQLNNLVEKVNSKLQEVVLSFGTSMSNKLHFVNYDASFKTRRFCEERFTEPQKKGEERLDLFMHQYYTPDGQLDDNYDSGNITQWTKDLTGGMNAFVKAHPNAKVAKPYADSPIVVNDFPFPRIPSGVKKIFHPTQAGHRAIAQNVFDMWRDNSPV
ncbi:SGNH hydrolase-type esterase domain-containing protein [Podospora didyma]|uniref:SGNH hydrolase-type esterase domain-containing protein n=1 Tax=Podospora didyma TaxID=330526 RepID=A0AAE0TV44_9PEZI|nr:SGNH hydrolase-type esterase domain-containing protein [Podospora didyma]